MGFLDYADVFFISLWTDKVFHILNISLDVWVATKPHTHICLWDQKPWLLLPILPWISPGQSLSSTPLTLRSPTGFTVVNDSTVLRIYAELVRSLLWLWGPNSGMKVFALIRIHCKKQQRALHDAPYSDGIRHASSTHSTQSSYL